jgi:hypothetical protein
MKNGQEFRIYASFTKGSIDHVNRTVTGIAQVEGEPDTQGDIVDFAASKKAFAAWPGNIREMHGPKAVGRSVSWWADPMSKRIYVKARISEGAEDTWKKVLDGTLTGYSIGGQQLAARREFDKSTGRAANRITAYRLNELSLVDSPANPACVITAIHKRANGILEATDVLGQLHKGARMDKKAVVTEIRNFTKGAKPDDEFLVIRKGDIDSSRSDKLIVLKKDAAVVRIRKDDMDGMADGVGGATEDPGQGPGDMANIDLEDHATNMANAHRDLCKMAGIDDHVGHYEDATEGDDDQGGGDGDGMLDTGDESGDDLQMGRRSGNLRKNRRKNRSRSLSEREVQKRIDKALGEQKATLDAAMAKTLDEIKKSVGGGALLAPRKDGIEGEPLTKTIGEIVGQDGDRLSKGSAGRYQALAKRKSELDDRAKYFIEKMDRKQRFTNDEDIERSNVQRELTRVEVEMAQLAQNAHAV